LLTPVHRLETEPGAARRPEEAAAAEAVSVTISLSALVKGAVLGVILAVVLIFFGYVCSGKLRTAEEMTKLYGVTVLGSTRKRSGKELAGLDALIWKGQHPERKNLTAEGEMDLAVSAAWIQTQETVASEGQKDTAEQKVYLTGSGIEELDPEVLTAFAEKLSHVEADGTCLQPIVGKNLLTNAEALLEAKQAGAVILLEEKRVSMYRALLQEVRTLRDNEIRIVGSVILND